MRGEGESGTHFQTDLSCPQNGEIPRYKRDAGCQAEVSAGAAGSRSAEALHSSRQKHTVTGALLNRQTETQEG